MNEIEDDTYGIGNDQYLKCISLYWFTYSMPITNLRATLELAYMINTLVLAGYTKVQAIQKAFHNKLQCVLNKYLVCIEPFIVGYKKKKKKI